jgi:hypothetical protein
MVHDEKQQNLSELDAVNGEGYSNDNDVEFADKSMTIGLIFNLNKISHII